MGFGDVCDDCNPVVDPVLKPNLQVLGRHYGFQLQPLSISVQDGLPAGHKGSGPDQDKEQRKDHSPLETWA
jgi:hypothetical protein